MQNFAHLDQEWRKFWKNSRKFWDFLINISMENWRFSQLFTKYFLDFCLLPESIYPWKIRPNFYNNFSDFGWGGGTFRRSPLPTLLIIERNFKSDQIMFPFLGSLLKSFNCYIYTNTFVLVNEYHYRKRLLLMRIDSTGNKCSKKHNKCSIFTYPNITSMLWPYTPRLISLNYFP